MKRLLLPLLTVALLSACAVRGPDERSPYEVQRMAHVQDGTVISVRSVRVDGHQTGIGGAAGAVTGAVAGSTIGGYRDSAVFSALGFILGGVIGNAIERDAGRQTALEFIIQLRNGERVSVVQAQGQEQFAPGDAVMIVSQGRSARVTRALPPVAPEAARAPAGETPR